VCSATLVASRVVLTAAHCVENLGAGSSIDFLVGENYMPPELRLSSSEWHIHPDYAGSSGGYGSPPYDIAVIILDEDATAHGLEPIPVNLEHTMLAGNDIQAVGYGTTDEGGWNTQRWWTTMPVISETALLYTTDGQDVTGICQGDSGGPMLYDMPGEGVHVMGVVSSGEEGCVGLTFYPRTDSVEDFLDDLLPIGACGYETLEGRCEGDTAIWCEDDAVMSEDCAAAGKVCGDDGTGLMRCVDPPPPCGDETWEGRCDGEVAIWCEDDEVFYHDCASFGWLCGINPDGLHRCVDGPCRGETWEGRCDGDTAIWCEDETILTHACADFGFECGPDGEGLNRCVEPGSVDECTRLGHEGECVVLEDGHDHARWCDDGVIRDRDCTVCEQTCGWASDVLGYYCL
jgi:V8-like Glu-specific endopeptidase